MLIRNSDDPRGQDSSEKDAVRGDSRSHLGRLSVIEKWCQLYITWDEDHLLSICQDVKKKFSTKREGGGKKLKFHASGRISL